MKKTIFTLALAAALGVISSCTPSKDAYISQEALQAVSDTMDAYFPADAPGAAILVMQKDSILLSKCCGWGNVETKEPITPETNFCLASISKQFTAVGILKLCEMGKMSLDDKVNSFFPQFTNSIWDGITVRHIISHSSGLPDARLGYTYPQRVYCDDSRSIAFFDTLSWVCFQPGTAFQYINPTFVLAGRIIEKVSGEPFADFMRKYIFEPAGMNNSQYFEFTADEVSPNDFIVEETPIVNASHGYVEADSGWVECDFGETRFYATRADGALYSSLAEMACWEKALHSGTLMADSILQQAWEPQISVTDSEFGAYNNHPNTYYGLGWFIEPATEQSGKVIYHTGENGGYRNIVARYPDKETMVVILSTRPYGIKQYDLLQKVEAILGL